MAFEVIGDRRRALASARGSNRLATTSGLKLVALRARAQICSIANEEEAATSATTGERLAAELLTAVPEDQRESFARQPDLLPLLSVPLS